MKRKGFAVLLERSSCTHSAAYRSLVTAVSHRKHITFVRSFNFQGSNGCWNLLYIFSIKASRSRTFVLFNISSSLNTNMLFGGTGKCLWKQKSLTKDRQDKPSPKGKVTLVNLMSDSTLNTGHARNPYPLADSSINASLIFRPGGMKLYIKFIYRTNVR